jgi:predicted lipoprotein with Yx(FWY)xxD motif
MRRRAAGLLLAGWLVAACGGAGTTTEPAQRESSSPAPSTTSAEPSVSESPSPSRTTRPRPDGTRITTTDSDYGPMLFDHTGQAIYLFDKERTSRPDCYGACADAWPPVLTTGAPRALGATRENLLGTTKRRDGSRQVTYAGHPLYFYAHEGKNQVLCHDIVEYGGRWLVVQPDGRPAP